jgi:hypothetical protein
MGNDKPENYWQNLVGGKKKAPNEKTEIKEERVLNPFGDAEGKGIERDKEKQELVDKYATSKTELKETVEDKAKQVEPKIQKSIEPKSIKEEVPFQNKVEIPKTKTKPIQFSEKKVSNELVENIKDTGKKVLKFADDFVEKVSPIINAVVDNPVVKLGSIVLVPAEILFQPSSVADATLDAKEEEKDIIDETIEEAIEEIKDYFSDDKENTEKTLEEEFDNTTLEEGKQEFMVALNSYQDTAEPNFLTDIDKNYQFEEKNIEDELSEMVASKEVANDNILIEEKEDFMTSLNEYQNEEPNFLQDLNEPMQELDNYSPPYLDISSVNDSGDDGGDDGDAGDGGDGGD